MRHLLRLREHAGSAAERMSRTMTDVFVARASRRQRPHALAALIEALRV